MKEPLDPFESNQMMNFLLEGIPGAVIMYQADDNRSVLYFNQNACTLFDCASAEEFEAYSGGRFDHLLKKSDLVNIEHLLSDGQKKTEHMFVKTQTARKEEKLLEVYGESTNQKAYGRVFVLFLTEAENRENLITFAASEIGEYYDAMELLGNGLEQAILENQFVVYYQPQYNQRLNYLYGAEALVRWKHPKKGMIAPMKFIPFLEKTGMIGKLDEFVLKKACEDQRQWLDEGKRVVPISVNLSRRDLQSEDICYKIEKILKEAHLPKDYICLEITESAYMDDPSTVIRVVKKFQKMGFKVEMDDFGSGYSSLNSLKDITVDVLKLDLKFIEGKGVTDRGGEILASVIRMAHGLGMSIIAEGVETREQSEFLNSIGCYYAQGYYFDRPMPAPDFEQRLLENELDFVRDVRNSSKRDISSNFYASVSAEAVYMDDDLGASAIIEYDGKNVALIRMNNAFTEMFAGLKENFREKRLKWASVFASGYEENYLTALQYAIKKKGVSECETLNCTLENENRYFWTHTWFKYLEEFDGICTLYIRVENIDKYRNAMISNAQLYYELDKIQQSGVFGMALISEKAKELAEVNDIAANMLGYTIEEVMELERGNLYALVHEKDRKPLKELLNQQIYREPYVFSTRVRLLCKDGSYRAMEMIGTMKKVFGGARVAKVLLVGSPESFLTVDQLEEEGAEKLERIISDMKMVANELSGAYIQYSPETDSIVYANETFCEMLGYTQKEFDEKQYLNYEEIIWQADKNRILGKIDQDFREYGFFSDCEYRLIRKNGEPKWVQAKNHNLVLASGQKVTFITYQDMDAIKALDQEFSYLRELGAIVDQNAYNGAIIYQVEGKRWILTYVSTAFLTMTGYSEEEIRELTKNDPLALVHPEDREQIRKKAFSHGKAGDHYEFQYRMLHAKGGYIWLTAYSNGFEVGEQTYIYQLNNNISNAKELEATLQEDNQQLDTIVNAIPGGVILFELLQKRRARIVYASRGIAEISGRTIEEYTGEVKKEHIPNIYPSDEPLFAKALDEIASTGEDLHVSIRVVHVDGHIIWLDVVGHIVGEKNGNPLMLAVFRDISSETNRYLSSMTESTIGTIVSEIGTHEVIYHNEIMEKYCKGVFHLSFEEICQKLIYDQLSEENSLEESILYEYQLQDSYFKVQLMHKTWYGRDCYVCYLSNIDVMTLLNKSMRLALEEPDPNQALNKMMEFWGKEMKSDRAYLFEIRDDLYYDTYEYCAEGIRSEKQSLQAIPREVDQIWRKSFEQEGYALIRDLEEIKDSDPMLYEVLKPQELTRVLACPIYHDGELAGFYGLDNPPLQKMESISAALPIIGNFLDTLIIRRELMEASHAKTDFLSHMSHDIRTPLNGIMGITHIMEEHCGERDKMLEYLAKVKTLSKQLESLINDVLDMSRIESGKVELAHETFHLTESLQALLPGLKVMAEEKGVCLKDWHFDNQNQMVVASPVHLQRIIMNIFSNAIKYNREGGSVEGWLSEKQLDETYSEYQFVVKDTGIGMSEEFLKTIYEPFERENKSTDTNYTGTGLGMAITKELVDMMGGRIEIASKKGEGTCVTVTLPLERATQKIETQSEDMEVDLLGKKILLVEDNMINLEIAEYILTEKGAVVDTAGDGQQAVERFCESQQKEYDVILMDMMMPVMNGIEATREIRALDREDAGTIPIIAMTANAFQEDVRKCREAGMNEHIAKPLDVQVMMAKIAKCLSEKE